MAKLIRGMTHDGSARILAIDSRDIVGEAISHHGTTPVASAALGRLLTATAMVGSLMPEKECRITFSVKGDGPLGTLMAIADYCGNVKGYAENPHAELLLKENGKLDVGAGVGKGMFAVIREDGVGEPHIGTVGLVSGEIAEDIATYFAESEQIPTLCALGVTVDRDGSCLAAGGVLIQLLPYPDEGVVSRLEENAAVLSDISRLFAEGKTPKDVLELALAGIPYDLFDELECAYLCDCSRERMLGAIGRLGKAEILSMLDEEEAERGERSLEASCRFCGSAYRFPEEELLRAAEEG